MIEKAYFEIIFEFVRTLIYSQKCIFYVGPFFWQWNLMSPLQGLLGFTVMKNTGLYPVLMMSPLQGLLGIG